MSAFTQTITAGFLWPVDMMDPEGNLNTTYVLGSTYQEAAVRLGEQMSDPIWDGWLGKARPFGEERIPFTPEDQ